MTVEREHWTLDKRIPILALGAAVVQTVIFIILAAVWLTNIENALLNYDKRLNVAEERIARQDTTQGILLVAVARLEEQSKAQTAALLRIEAAIVGSSSNNRR